MRIEGLAEPVPAGFAAVPRTGSADHVASASRDSGRDCLAAAAIST